MKTVGLIDVDSKMPNLALMKLSAWHKSKGDCVELAGPLCGKYDVTYASKVFSYTPDYALPTVVEKGGTGYNMTELPASIEHMCPDYELYNMDYSMGFLTRGCPNHCEWCVVPDKEGPIRAHADIHEFLRHNKCILLDNNVLAHPHGLEQIKKLAELKVKVDFNQGLDARLIDFGVAAWLAQLKWLKPLRLACDSQGMKKHIRKAVRLLREANCKPKAYLCYMLVKEDIADAHDRSEFLRGWGLDPFAQPYRDFKTNKEPTAEQKHFARWVNHKATWKTVTWENYGKRNA